MDRLMVLYNGRKFRRPNIIRRVHGQYATTGKMKIVQRERDTIGILSVEDAAVSMAASDGLVWRSQCKL